MLMLDKSRQQIDAELSLVFVFVQDSVQQISGDNNNDQQRH